MSNEALVVHGVNPRAVVEMRTAILRILMADVDEETKREALRTLVSGLSGHVTITNNVFGTSERQP